jgi:drug/metabolite transporter (DMT)-like permease
MIYLLLAAIIWGSSFPTITYALRDISPFLFVVLRFALAFLILLPRYRSLKQFRTLFHRDLFLISIPNALAFILQFKAQELTTASKTALFVNSTPIFVAVLAAVILKDRLKGRQIVAMIIACTGIVITSTRLDFSGFASVNRGDVLSVLTGLCWAVFIVFSGGVVRKYGPVTLAQALYFWTVVMTLPLLGAEDLEFAWSSVPAVAYLAAVATVVGYLCYLKGVQSVSALSTSLIILVEVVVAFLIANLLLGESFSAIETVGVVMVVAGVVTVLRNERAQPPGQALDGDKT